MLKDKIEVAQGNLPINGGFRANFIGKIIAVLRDENGNIKEYREVDV